jgi:ABC-type transport system involved in multi-copper enzyme maturation permease subunit
MNGIFTIMHLTLDEAKGRRVVLAALVLGVAFLLIFGAGYYFIYQDAMTNSRGAMRIGVNTGMVMVAMAGLYAVNFLIVMMAVLMPIDTLSGDIRSGVIQTLVTKPLHREQILLGKWLAYWVILAVYLLLMAGGVVLIVRAVSGLTLPNVVQGIALIFLEGTVLMTLSILGGTRLSTLANGVTVMGLYGLGFIGGWMEQIGTLLGNTIAQNFGVVTSLLVPTEAMWQLAAYNMQPSIVRDAAIIPFSVASVPSPSMVVWAVLYIAVTLIIALRQFRTRDL